MIAYMKIRQSRLGFLKPHTNNVLLYLFISDKAVTHWPEAPNSDPCRRKPHPVLSDSINLRKPQRENFHTQLKRSWFWKQLREGTKPFKK